MLLLSILLVLLMYFKCRFVCLVAGELLGRHLVLTVISIKKIDIKVLLKSYFIRIQ